MSDLHFCGATFNVKQLLHSIRFADGHWQLFFGDVGAQESNNPGSLFSVDCAGIDGELHVCTADFIQLNGPGGGKLWHTIRFADGTWQPFFDDVKARMSNDPGRIDGIGCASIDGDLHVCVTIFGVLTPWHTIRFADGTWQPFFGNVNAQMSNPIFIGGISCAGVDGNLHICAASQDGKLWHTIRFADGTWQPFFDDVKALESNDPGNIDGVSCAGVDGNLHICSTTAETGKLWHTIRFADGTWQSFFGDVKTQMSNDPGTIVNVSCAGADNGDLHICVTNADGKPWHTIRFADGTWQGFFDDVRAQVSNDQRQFTSLGIAGL